MVNIKFIVIDKKRVGLLRRYNILGRCLRV